MSREDILENIAANITSLRRREGMTQAALAEKLGYSDKSISKWERADGTPDIVCLKRIADLFGVSVDYLLREHGEDEMPPSAETAKPAEKNYVVNRQAIIWLSVAAVWLAALAAYVILHLCSVPFILPFVIALFVTALLFVIFNSLWGRRSLVFWTVTLLVWSILFLVTYLFREHHSWPIMVLGLPATVVVFLACRIKTKKNDE